MHTAQKNFMEIAEESNHFIAMMKEKVCSIDPDHILNIDKTPIPFLCNSKKMLHTKDSKIITKRVTLAATVTGSGKMLPPMLIFKGATSGRIAKQEFRTYPDSGHYICQNAWMDEDMMHPWIDQVLVLWKMMKLPGVVPILALDAYPVHMLGTVVNHIQSIGIEVIHIPAAKEPTQKLFPKWIMDVYNNISSDTGWNA
jgi:hypothetical protein